MHLRGLYALTNVSIGLWTPGGTRTRKLLLCLPEKCLFVLIVVHGVKPSKNGALGRALEQVNYLLDKRNPFSTQGAAGQRPSIVALELEWEAVVGTDFLFPLHQDARLVLESRLLTKRLFHTMSDLDHFYGWRSPPVRGSTVRAAWHSDPRLGRLTSTLSRRVSMMQQAQAQVQAQGQNSEPVVVPHTPARQPQAQLHTPVQPQRQPLLHAASPALQVLRRQLSAPLHGLYSAQRRGRRQRSLKARQAQQQQEQEQQQQQQQQQVEGAAQAARGSTDDVEAAGCSPDCDCGSIIDQASSCLRLQSPFQEPCSTPALTGRKDGLGARRVPVQRDDGEEHSIGGSPQPGPIDPAGTSAASGCEESDADLHAPGNCLTCGNAASGRPVAQAQLPLPPSPWLSQATPAPPGRPPRAAVPSAHAQQQRQLRPQQLQQQQQQQGGIVAVPTAARWTSVTAEYANRTVIINFRDASLTQDLRVFVQSDMRLLKLYESGLPAWAVILPSYGLPYHPWMRRATWLLFVMLSFFSMACGFYDLYKNVPYVKQFVTASLLRLHLPAAALFEWLERHTQIRLSILLTWLFSRSPLFSAGLRALRSAAALGSQLLAPVARTLAPLAAAVGAAVSSTLQPVIRPLAWACFSAAAAVEAALGSAGTTVWRSAAASWQAVSSTAGWAFQPLLQLLSSLFQLLAAAWCMVSAALATLAAGPALVLGSAAAAVVTAVQELRQALLPVAAAAWQALRLLRAALAPFAGAATMLFAAARSAFAVAAPAVRLVRSSGAAAAAVAGASSTTSDAAGGIAAATSWLVSELSLAQDFMLNTGSRCLKGAQAVVNFLATWAMAISRHRVSLLLQAKHALPLPLPLVPPLASGGDDDAELDSSAAAAVPAVADSTNALRRPGVPWTAGAELQGAASRSGTYVLQKQPVLRPGLLPDHVGVVGSADHEPLADKVELASIARDVLASDWPPSRSIATGMEFGCSAAPHTGYSSEDWWDSARGQRRGDAVREAATGSRSSLDLLLNGRAWYEGNEASQLTPEGAQAWRPASPQQSERHVQARGAYLRPGACSRAKAAAGASTAGSEEAVQPKLQRSSWSTVSACLSVESSQGSGRAAVAGSQAQVSSPGCAKALGGEVGTGAGTATSRLRWLGELVGMARAASASQLSALAGGDSAAIKHQRLSAKALKLPPPAAARQVEAAERKAAPHAYADVAAKVSAGGSTQQGTAPLGREGYVVAHAVRPLEMEAGHNLQKVARDGPIARDGS